LAIRLLLVGVLFSDALQKAMAVRVEGVVTQEALMTVDFGRMCGGSWNLSTKNGMMLE